MSMTLLGGDLARASEKQAAEEVLQPFEVGVFGGLHFYNKKSGLGRFVDSPEGYSPDTGGAFGFRLGYNLNKWIGAEAEGLISPTRTRDNQMRENVLGYRGQIIATVIPWGYVRPFVVLGYGALSAFPQYTDIIPRDTDGFFHVGVGAKVPIYDTFGLRLDGRVMAPAAIFHKIATVGNETHYDGPDWEILLAAYMGLGGQAAPPPSPPPAPPPAPVVDQDPDHDGILGDKDKCPNEPEDFDGFQDDDGCPDLDNDGDGIPDKLDKCPNEPEDKDGFQDDDGCPDLDNDGDGIPDAVDKCPNEPETKNGYQDEDGCPDEVPAAIKKFTGVIQGVNFKTGSAEITKGSHSVLDKAVQVLNDYPDIKLEISGHTDNVGKETFNKELSQKRADSVKAYFVEQGIKAERFTTIGYGMEKPIANNKTAAGKAQNRRTEFHLIGGQ
jgi:OOP family OmpA-OmpF porin